MKTLPILLCTASEHPSYGELIDLFEEVEEQSFNNEHLLCSKFKERYPSISIGRPRRFYETVQRIIAPLRPSTQGRAVLTGSPLSAYRSRVWKPRVRNTAAKGMLYEYFLSKSLYLFHVV